MFVDAAGGNFRLRAGSPCIDRGDNAVVAAGAVDLDGNPRIVNGWVDMGAYESTAPRTHTRESDTPVPYVWLDDYRPWQGVTDYEALANLRGSNGYLFWESYLAGLVPTDAASKFMITNIVVNAQAGAPVLHWAPHRSDRTYTVLGKTNLTDSTWHCPTNSATRFFKVNVGL
jgi:hypothetical protein